MTARGTGQANFKCPESIPAAARAASCNQPIRDHRAPATGEMSTARFHRKSSAMMRQWLSSDPQTDSPLRLRSPGQASTGSSKHQEQQQVILIALAAFCASHYPGECVAGPTPRFSGDWRVDTEAMKRPGTGCTPTRSRDDGKSR
eukprot:6190197-Pleurochrysis_carterae.AAC.1